VRILKTEVGKGFMRTPFDHELVDPKTKINLENKIIFFSSFFLSGGGGEENPKIIFKSGVRRCAWTSSRRVRRSWRVIPWKLRR
jgi:hypothetical protein